MFQVRQDKGKQSTNSLRSLEVRCIEVWKGNATCSLAGKMTGGDGGNIGAEQHVHSPNSARRPLLRKSPSSVRAWLIARDAGFTSRFKTGPLSGQVVLQGAFCFCNVISMVDTLFCSYVLDFLVYTVNLPGKYFSKFVS